MAKTLIKQTFSGDITIVDGVKRLTGVQIVDHWEVTDEDGDVLTKRASREAGESELAILLGGEAANLNTALTTLTTQHQALVAEKAAVDAKLTAAVEAAAAVAAADASWDASVRGKIESVLA